MDSVIGGGQNQAWVSRGALDRENAKNAQRVSWVLGSLLALSIGGNVYGLTVPHETPVIIAQQRDGSYAPYMQNLAPDQPGTQKLLADWFGAFRLGDNDPQSYPARQTAALIPDGDGTPGAAALVVREYNQQVADSGAKVSPTIRDVSCTDNECVVDWNETVKSPSGETTQHAFRGWVTIAYDKSRQLLKNDPLTNPYGLYIVKIRSVEVGHAR